MRLVWIDRCSIDPPSSGDKPSDKDCSLLSFSQEKMHCTFSFIWNHFLFLLSLLKPLLIFSKGILGLTLSSSQCNILKRESSADLAGWGVHYLSEDSGLSHFGDSPGIGAGYCQETCFKELSGLECN